MSESPFSPVWYRCADLKPQLRSHTRIHRHDYRDDIWYVLEDTSSGRFHRFSPSAYHIIGLMDGHRTVGAIWQSALDELSDDAPTQGEIIQLLAQLHNADVLQSDVPPDLQEIFSRHQHQRQKKLRQRLAHPLAIRIPLFDPERMLVRLLPIVRPLFGWFGILLWSVVVILGLVTLVTHWSSITEDGFSQAISIQNLLILWLVYPVVKLLHELGHAFATKVWGGEVHEIGVMLLVLFPVPYVEASAASAFRSKYQRMVVGAAGILVELFLAALALLVWINVEPGLVSSIAYNVMLIGGVSTLFFNGNPLLRFDGYYVLADALEMPNLAVRSKKYLSYLVQRYLFRVDDLKSPATGRGESGWLVIYGVASFVYRTFILLVIALFIAGKYFFIGVALAVWALLMQFVVPSAKALAYLFTNHQLRGNRVRATIVTLLLCASIGALLFYVPAPHWTRAEGIVWVPDQAQVRAGADGNVLAILVADGNAVTQGEPLLQVQDPFINAQVAIYEARRKELNARLIETEFADQTNAQLIRQEIVSADADLERARERASALTINSPADGIFVLPNEADVIGRYVRRGELVGYVKDRSHTTVRAVIGQDDIGLVRERTEAIQVRVADWSAEPIPANVQRAVPAATDQLPTQALGSGGGGPFPVDPRDGSGLKTMEKVFQIDLTLPEHANIAELGGRVYIRFDHGDEPAGVQMYRKLRQLFLSRLSV
ncbi:MAG: HlyD family efflux transporter periplasmic adaptor subunit [Pseudomonadota bacterium]